MKVNTLFMPDERGMLLCAAHNIENSTPRHYLCQECNRYLHARLLLLLLAGGGRAFIAAANQDEYAAFCYDLCA